MTNEFSFFNENNRKVRVRYSITVIDGEEEFCIEELNFGLRWEPIEMYPQVNDVLLLDMAIDHADRSNLCTAEDSGLDSPTDFDEYIMNEDDCCD